MIKTKLIGLVTLLASIGATLCACDPTTPKEERDYDDPNNDINISFVETSNGKKLVVNDKYDTEYGAFGVMIGYDDVKNISDILSTNYSSVENVDDKYICNASITTDNGSTISTVDTIYIKDKKLELERTFTVNSTGTGDLGFSTYFFLDAIGDGAPGKYQWFCPGNYYGNDHWTFTGDGVKTAYTSDRSMITNDNSGAPLIMCYKDGVGASILDTTDGYRETIFSDYGVHDKHIQYDERFNMGGVGISEYTKSGKTHSQLVQSYPAYSYNFCGIKITTAQYRMLPMNLDLTRSISLEVEVDTYHSYYSASRSNYRQAYKTYAVSDKRYSTQDTFSATLQYLDKSFGYINSIPQYMCNSDHPNPDSGFLYRNADIAGLMLSAGRRLNNQGYIDDALTILEDQLSHDRLDTNIACSTKEQYVNRTRADSLYNMAVTYKTELKNGYEHNDWKYYLVEKANKLLSSTYWPDALFYTEMYNITQTKTYLDKAKELMKVVESEHLKNHYYGTLVSTSTSMIVEKEASIFALMINTNLYESTNDVHYLNLAEKAALVVESFELLQPVNLDNYDNIGYGVDSFTGESFNQGSMGNKRFMPYGLSYVNAQTTSADNCLALCAPDFYRLYKMTNDSHYYDVYDFLTYNTVLTLDMGDKVGLMDDIKYSSGIGFQNEYFGVSITSDPASYKRGSIHDSNLAWNEYGVLQMYERMNYILGGDKITACDDNNRNYDLKKNKYTNLTSSGYVTDLNEMCDVVSITGYEGSFEWSIDNVTWNVANQNDSVKAQYIRLPSTVDIDSIKIIGLPINYVTLSYDSDVRCSTSSLHKALDWNYSTYCTLTGGTTVTLDLNELHTVTLMALKNKTVDKVSFSASVSSDGSSYVDYMTYSDSYYYLHTCEKTVANVRFIKLYIPSGATTLNITEFKVLGI